MIRNYFKTAWRNLAKRKGFSIINVSGLAVGMAGAALIVLWLQNEISFDKFHAGKERLYEVYGLAGNANGERTVIPVVPEPLAPALQQNFPEVESKARIKNTNSFLLATGDKSFTGIKGCFADASFLQLFSFPLMQGSINEQLKNIYSLTITEQLAKKMFGTTNAIGKTIRIDSADYFKVTGVLKDLPSNTRFRFEYLLPWDYLKKIGYSNESWLSNNTSAFLLVKPNTNITAFNEKIKNISRQYAGRNDIWTHFLFPLDQWHLYAEFENGKPAGGRINTVRVFGIIAAFILLIACINFMNLSTARSEKRAKEVGIRKVTGAGKGLLIGQFIAEAFLTACIAGIIAIGIVQLVLPSFNMLVGTQLSVPYTSANFWICAFVFIVITSLLAGSYPAFYLSSFKPVGLFKKQFRKSQSAVSPRKVLVVLQFTFAIILVVATLVVRNQVQYAQDRYKGYSDNNLVQVNFSGDIDKNYALIKQELIKDDIAFSVTKTMTGITEGGSRTWGLRWPGENPRDTNTTITIYSADADLVRTTGMQLLEGRDIDINRYASDSFAVLLNETAVKLMGFKSPVGKVLSQPYNNITWHVVGVVKDYIQESPYEAIPPTVIMGPAGWFNTMHIRFNPSLSTAGSLAKAEWVFKKYNPAYPFDYQFVDQQYANRFDSEQRTKMMAGLFAALAIFISCLGLFGLSAYLAESRIKEIGIRKVLGASIFTIAGILSLEFIRLVIISIVIAVPVAWHVMSRWVDNYAYRVSIGWEVFVTAGLLAMLIALGTVSFQAIKAAVANPVRSLRTE